MEQEKLDNLIAYSEALDNLGKNKSTYTFPNRDHDHASIALSKILKYSTDSFILFDDDLKGDIVNKNDIVSFRESVVDFITRGGNLKVVISDKEDSDDLKLRMFFEAIAELYPQQVELKLASPEFKRTMKTLNGSKVNFCIGDNDKYRLETYENPVSEKTRAAKGSFNDTQQVRILMEKFNENYVTCSDYIN